MKKSILLLTLMIVLGFTLLGFGFDLKWRSAVTFSPAAPSGGDTVTFTCRIKSGDAASDNIDVDLRIDGAKVGDIRIAHLDRDELRDVSITWTAVAGAHRAEMVIDPLDVIGGENQDNNIRSVTLTVGAGSGGDPGGDDFPPDFDLRWQGPIVVTPDHPGVGDVITLTCTLEAINAPADSILVRLLVDGAIVANTTVAHLASGGTTPVSLTWTATDGTHTGEMVIDPLNTIPVEDPTNNTVSATGTIGEEPPGMDPEPARTFDLLWVGDVSVSPASPRTGSPVTFTANIKAVGYDVNTVRISMQRLTGDIRTMIGHIIVPHLTADTPQAVTMSWLTPFSGDHSVFLSAEQTVVPVMREDISNNRISKTFTVREPAAPVVPRVNPLIRARSPMIFFGEAACRGNEDKTVDLEVARFKADPVRGNPDRRRITVRIKNNGLKCVRAFRFDVNDSYGQLIYRQSVSHLPGKTYALTGNTTRVFTFNLDKAIVRQIRTCRKRGRNPRDYTDVECSILNTTVDPDNTVRESVEHNNIWRGYPIHWE